MRYKKKKGIVLQLKNSSKAFIRIKASFTVNWPEASNKVKHTDEQAHAEIHFQRKEHPVMSQTKIYSPVKQLTWNESNWAHFQR